MFTLLSKITRRLTRFPKTVLLITFVLALLSIYPIHNLHWDLQLQDTLGSREAPTENFQKIEEDFGGLGSLTVVLQSKDSLKNYRAAQTLYEKLKQNPLVHFVEYETDLAFYKKRSLLYVSESDLDELIRRIHQQREAFVRKNNPLFVDLQETADTTTGKKISEQDSSLSINDIEEKYYKKMGQTHASSDGTIRVVDIYPSHSLSDLQASRDLLSLVKQTIDKSAYRNDVQLHFTGKVYNTIQTGRTLLPEAKRAGKITALFILVILIIFFFKQPQLILVSALPIALPILYTLALAGVLYGRINLFTLLLALLLPGQACQVVGHVYSRYFHERTRNLSTQLCIESAVLGIGPSTAVSSCIMAALFASMLLVPVPGLKELAVLGTIGSLLNWLTPILVMTALLRIFQRKQPFQVKHYLRFHQKYRFSLLPYRANVILIAIVSVISLTCLIYGSSNLKFFYDFGKTEIPIPKTLADTLIAQTSFPQMDPIIVQLPHADAGKDLYRNFVELKKRGEIPTIEKIYTLGQFSFQMTDSRRAKLDSLTYLLSQDFLSKLDSAQLHNIQYLTECLYRTRFSDSDYPMTLRQKFSDNKGNEGVFAFIFHNVDVNDGLACRRLNKDLKKMEGINNGNYRISGQPIVRANLLDQILSNLDKSILVGSILVWFFLLIFYNRFSRSVFTVLPSIFAMSWLLIFIRLFDIELSVYSSLAFPILIGASVDGSVQLWSSFYTKQEGTALTLLQRKFSHIGTSQLAALIGAYGLLISPHPGLKSIGQVALIGLICIFAAQFTIFPLIAGSLDNYRIRKRQRKQHNDTSSLQ